jgi:hypothetical protein
MVFAPRKLMLGLLLLAGFSTALIGCVAENEASSPGSLEVTWELNPQDCELAGVEQVSVQLLNDSGQVTETFACADGEGLLLDIPAAKYELTLLGVDSNQDAIFTSETLSITVEPEKLATVDTLHLRPKPPELTVEWGFANGKVCGANGVDEVNIAIYDDASFKHADQTFPCSEGVGVMSDLEVAGDFILVATAESSEGALFRDQVEVSLERGEEKDLQVELAPVAADES